MRNSTGADLRRRRWPRTRILTSWPKEWKASAGRGRRNEPIAASAGYWRLFIFLDFLLDKEPARDILTERLREGMEGEMLDGEWDRKGAGTDEI